MSLCNGAGQQGIYELLGSDCLSPHPNGTTYPLHEIGKTQFWASTLSII